jgi:hypothetical protein
LESIKEDIFENNFFECPFCVCQFTSKVDLDSHMEVFGSKKGEHIQKLDAEHRLTDRTYRGTMDRRSKETPKRVKKSYWAH